MAFFEKISSSHRVGLAISPTEADIAIVSIDEYGTAGALNMLVLREYGYTEKDLPKREDLKDGFSQLPPSLERRGILFVVTVNKENTSENLKKNLYHVLIEFRGWFYNKKVWVPLMGTGSGGMRLDESYLITVETINKFQQEYPTQEATFILSIPDNKNGRNLINQISEPEKNKKADPELFLKSLNCNFYLADAFWSGQDQVERFLNEGIWKKGQGDDSYADIINSTKKNDVIILKSVFPLNSESNLRVIGMGVATEGSEDGASLKVDWRIRDISFDIPGLGKYRRTIEVPSYQDVVTVFSFLDPNEWQKLLSSSTNHVDKIAGLLSDNEKGKDYLAISKDVIAFARVIAAKSFEPPLAIALFGKWGSGKSFFMRELKEQVIDFSKKNQNNMYCQGVVHIHFNAWSYMDANLWASFVSKIFEALQEYIKKDNSAKLIINSVKVELSKQLNVTRVGIEAIQEKKESIEKQIDGLVKKKNQKTKEVAKKIESLKKQTAWDVLNNVDQQFNAKGRILEELKTNNSFVKTEDELKNIIPEKYWSDPKEAYIEVRSKYTFLKEFFRRDKVGLNLFWLALILIIIFLTPFLLDVFTIKIKKINFLIPEAGISFLVMLSAAWRRAEIIYNKLQPIASSFWKIKEDYEELREEALAKFEQDEKALKLEIEKGKAEIYLYTEQLQKAQVVFEELDFKLNNAFATETLYSFIDERSKSEDYKKYLGIISTVRKDFEILNGLFIDHKSEIVNQHQAEKFRKYFDKPIERIILYVDDLDRCPEENVVQVLEAVNLLMAFPLFVVIVGVDPRWIKNALIKKYSLQFTGRINGVTELDVGVELIEPSNYLEKIFQIPFHLKNASTESVRDMIKQLAISKSAQTIESQNNISIDLSDAPDSENQGQKVQGEKKESEVNEPISPIVETTTSEQESIEMLELSDQEVELMQDMGDIIGPNPRAIKRFVNIYKIVKAHADYTVSPNGPIEELLALLFLLALSVGQFKKLAPSFEDFLNDEKNRDKPFTYYLQKAPSEDELQTTKHELNVILSNNNIYHIVQNTKATVFNNHNAFIKRFTFKNI